MDCFRGHFVVMVARIRIAATFRTNVEEVWMEELDVVFHLKQGVNNLIHDIHVGGNRESNHAQVLWECVTRKLFEEEYQEKH